MAKRTHNRPESGDGRRQRYWLALSLAGMLVVGVCLGLCFKPDDGTRAWTWIVGMAAGIATSSFALLHSYPRTREPEPVPARTEPSLVVLPDRRAPVQPQRPRIVAIGGGHGLSAVLRGLKLHQCHLTAIVTVADDGGSSGVLRREIGMPPPGDLRRCIAALAEAEPLMTRLFEYRFGQGSALDGHAFGNLFIAAMMGITGDFESAVIQSSRVLAVQGRIIPSSLDDVVLCAEVRQQQSPNSGIRLVRGQSKIATSGSIVERVYLDPENARGYPAAVRALLDADMILLGPGSLYTSILPNLLIRDIRDAMAASGAVKVYVCNVATQPGETDAFDVSNHVDALSRYIGGGFCDYVLANDNLAHRIPSTVPSSPVRSGAQDCQGCHVVTEDLVDTRLPWRHDSIKLASALLRLYHRHRSAALTEQKACG